LSKKKKEKKQGRGGTIFMFVSYLAIGGVCGMFMTNWLDRTGAELSDFLPLLIVFLLGVYAGMFLQIVIHEAGHLVFGLLTGYKFCSFRIGSFMIVRRDGKLHFCRFTLAGTGGQCLMCPPELKNGTMPVVLYNLGGSIMNILAAALFFALYAITRDVGVICIFFAACGVIGVGFAITNGVPLRLGVVNNDGHNAISLRKDKAATRALWIQLKVNERQTEGDRLRDMPEEWFAMPEDNLDNSLISAVAVLHCNRLMDQHRFSEAEETMLRLIREVKGLSGIYKGLLNCDIITCCLLTGRVPAFDEIMVKEQIAIMKAMKNYPAILRTNYLTALLHRNDPAAAEKAKAALLKLKKSYPNPGELEGEFEFVAMGEAVKNGEDIL